MPDANADVSLTRMDWASAQRKRVNAPPCGAHGLPVPVFGSLDPLESWRCLIRPGDNWLSVGPAGCAFGKVYGYPFTHAAECISQNGLVEALRGGVVPTDNSRYSNSLVVVTRWKNMTPEQQAFLADHAKLFIGMPYDEGELTWLVARGLFYVAAGPAVLLGHVGLGVFLRGLASAMNRRNLLDKPQAVICSRVLAEAARKANEAGLLPRLPVDGLGAGKGCLAPAHFASPKRFDWVLVKSGDPAPS